MMLVFCGRSVRKAEFDDRLIRTGDLCRVKERVDVTLSKQLLKMVQ